MALVSIRPTRLDRALSAFIAHHTRPGIEKVATAVTFAADEHVLFGVLTGMWLGSRFCAVPQRRAANHLVVTAAVSAVVPHLLKRLVDQQRPDRRIAPPRRGIPRSGKPYDAFPSGHAMHVGAIASALARFYPRRAGAIWTLGIGITATRVVLLAHWLTDVLAGLAMGAMIEKAVWRAFTLSVDSDAGRNATTRDNRTRRLS